MCVIETVTLNFIRILKTRKLFRKGPHFHSKAGAHLGGLFGYHGRPLCTAGSIKADKILNAVTAGLKWGCFGTGTVYISLLTLHSTTVLRNNNVTALSKWRLRSDMKQSTSLNIRNWYCVERTWFWISSSGSADSDAVRISYTATYTQERFCNISLHGKRTTVSKHNRSAVSG